MICVNDLNLLPGFEKLYVFMPKEGPPIGRDVSVGIKGESFAVMQEIADKYIERLEGIDGVTDIDMSYHSGKKNIESYC